MATEESVIDDGEFWLPSHFLSTNDDDNHHDGVVSMEPKSNISYSKAVKGGAMFQSDFGFGCFTASGGVTPWSDLSSPVGSSETESDEEDFSYLSGLTLQMAHSTLDDDEEGGLNNSNGVAFGSQFTTNKGRSVSGSPQSTLSPVARCGSDSSQKKKKNTWDLLHAAAGEVARMQQKAKEEEEGCYYSSFNDGFRYGGGGGGGERGGGLMGPPRKPSPPTRTIDYNSYLDGDGSYYPDTSLACRKMKASQLQLLRQEQIMKQQQQAALLREKVSLYNGIYNRNGQDMNRSMGYSSNARSNGGYGCVGGRNLGLSGSVWPPRQVGEGPGMHAVIIGNPAAKRESVGTGVFLPRRVGASADPRKKTVCSTVLLPARVVHALNLNLDDTQQPPRFNGSHFNNSFVNDTAAAAALLRHRNYGTSHQQQKRSLLLRPRQHHQHKQQVMGNSNEVGFLPQEWTY